ncbi:MAG: hypothetical protein GY799_25340 [Desulfobulbaceae bacterium]|nr:hypothetical protein [Desulfobulbaceae bacterium]
MTYAELNEIRATMGLTIPKMALLLGVAEGTYKGWGTRGKVPPYIESSARVHLALYRCKNK